MNLKVIKLKFNSPLHLGEAWIGLEGCNTYVYSDTLFSGLCNAWAYVEEDIESFISTFSKTRPFYISSAFPFEECNGQTTYYLPKPLLPLKLIGDKEMQGKAGKMFKEIEFIPLSLFNQWIKGEPLNLDVELLRNYKEEYKTLFVKYTLPKVQLDRITSASGIYHYGLVSFKRGAGLYFLVKYKNNDALSRLKVGLEVLSEIGLGGERSAGCGKFTFEFVDAEFGLIEPDSPNAYITLSLYYPDEEEKSSIFNTDIAYDLIQRRGWVDSYSIRGGYKRKSCWMFKEGSVFPQVVKGDIIDLTPDILKNRENCHHIYRYGLPFLIGVNKTMES
jgi:CRISPR-associated protein Csm4